jgi:hypothetical protein
MMGCAGFNRVLDSISLYKLSAEVRDLSRSIGRTGWLNWSMRNNTPASLILASGNISEMSATPGFDFARAVFIPFMRSHNDVRVKAR